MKVGTVTGNVVSTIRHDLFDGHRMLRCALDGPGGYLVAVDVVDAGVGDRVLILDEGTGARQILGVPSGPVRSVIVGIVDEVHEDDAGDEVHEDDAVDEVREDDAG